ncbi:hypothetical protein MN116_004608 [Schistosoma mekongi]|uniref:Caspase-7 n=1 Tax=Schistosoma mekongi TaxID=38744 RepID=A0AAE1ZD65_SCHME|nr:hypothetical protein MN116_004608 [Schistosoma mekongi]
MLMEDGVDNCNTALSVRKQNKSLSQAQSSSHYNNSQYKPTSKTQISPSKSVSCASLLPVFSLPSEKGSSYVYRTNGSERGLCVVFSVDKFDPILCLPRRTGSLVDVQNIKRAFLSLDFKVIVYWNPSSKFLFSVIQSISTQNLRDHDCFACVILSHGDEGGLIYATDGSIPVDRIIAPFRGDQCSDLRGKPKLFFIQACRGMSLDDGVFVCDGPSSNSKATDTATAVRRIPIEADLFIAYAVQPGYYAFRNSMNGSWFIRSLSDALLRYGNTLDLLSIMTRVNYDVAYEYESTAANPALCGKKQMPSFVSTLTKHVIFPPKRSKDILNSI